jgi:L-alanine-DL-glutamate epimerase-like enolase superfamily enzyme
MLAEPLRIDGDGCLRVPGAGGLGVELDEDAIAYHALEVGT